MIYKCKIEGRGPKNFSNHQNPIDLFINLRDSNVNRKEVLKNQIDYKSDLGKKKKKSKIKIRRSNKCHKKFSICFLFKRKNY